MTATVMAVATPAESLALSCPLDCVAVYIKEGNNIGIVKSTAPGDDKLGV